MLKLNIFNVTWNKEKKIAISLISYSFDFYLFIEIILFATKFFVEILSLHFVNTLPTDPASTSHRTLFFRSRETRILPVSLPGNRCYLRNYQQNWIARYCTHGKKTNRILWFGGGGGSQENARNVPRFGGGANVICIFEKNAYPVVQWLASKREGSMFFDHRTNL